MSADSPRHLIRRANLVQLMALPRVAGPAALARLLDRPKLKGHLSNIAAGRRGLGDELSARIEAVCGMPPGWMDQQHSVAGEKPATYLQAQVLSHHSGSDLLPLLTWEQIMKSTVPEIFRAVLTDDALAPEFPRGTEIVWSTRRQIAPGRLALVRDRHGQLHARQCHQGRAPGQWIAAAINPAFVNFDSIQDDLSVIAVFKGRLEPDD